MNMSDGAGASPYELACIDCEVGNRCA